MGFEDMTEQQRRAHHIAEAHDEDLRRYDSERVAAISRLRHVAGDGPLSLDDAACFLPIHPEWARYSKRKHRK